MPDVGLDSALSQAATWESVARRMVDLAVSALALLVLVVPMIIIGLTIKWTSVGRSDSAATRSPPSGAVVK